MDASAPAQHRSRAFKGDATRRFAAWAHSYDRSILNFLLFRPSYLTLLEELHAWQADHARRCRVLDIGCGTGSFAGLVAVAGLDADVVGLDFVPQMCVRARGKLPIGTDSVRFLAGDSEHLPFADASFDLVTCSNSFHHYPHQQAVVHEFRRVLAPGGRVVLIDGFRDNVIGWVVFDVAVARIEGHVHHAPWRRIDAYFRDAGLTEIRRRKFNLLFPAVATIGSAPALQGAGPPGGGSDAEAGTVRDPKPPLSRKVLAG
ncbi:MAG: methyltransferase domain-containing protein [Phycisphaerales bacterium]|nr:MAG: methyltransferase domain-containing protein [Phycisphaerales bacterium]